MTEFRGAVEKLSRGQVTHLLTRLKTDVSKILQSPFLNIECWRRWDKAGIRDRAKRVASSCHTYDKSHRIEQLFRHLYTLRNQILHGAATDQGRRNSETLRPANTILGVVVPALVGLVNVHHLKLPRLEPVPYPPSIGEGGRFNPLPLKGIGRETTDTHPRHPPEVLR